MAVNTEVRITDWGGNPQLTYSESCPDLFLFLQFHRERPGGNRHLRVRDQRKNRTPVCLHPLRNGRHRNV